MLGAILDNLLLVAIGLTVLLIVASFLIYRLTIRSYVDPPPPEEQPSSIRQEFRAGAVGAAKQYDQLRGALPGTSKPPIVALIGAPGASTEAICTAVSQASPPQLSRELLQSSLARTIRSPDGILLDFRDTLLSRSDWLET
ncbi:MAG: hypothetical protein AAF409_12110, partial [Pseudomonadota bacterium]